MTTDPDAVAAHGTTVSSRPTARVSWDTDGRNTSQSQVISQPVYPPRCDHSLARIDGMAHPSYMRDDPKPTACIGATGRIWEPSHVRAPQRVRETDDLSVGTMDGELTSAND
ncbi:MAG: hypothetical protein ABEH86_12610 [Haloarcula sp.]